MQSLISVWEVTKSFPKYRLGPLSFTLGEGNILGIIGRNGAGKTTLMRMMMGIYQFDSADEGDILLNGTSIRDNPVKYKENIAYVLNETPFAVRRSAVENGALYGEYYKTFDFEKYKRLLQEFKVLQNKPLSKLSKGEQLKQQLAFAMSYDAKIYFLDEPAGNLDVEFRDIFYGYMRELTADGTKSVIYASHLIQELEEFADYILWIENRNGNGRVSWFGNIDDLKEKYRMVETDEQIESLLDKACIVGGKKSENHNELLIEYDEKKIHERVKKYCRYADLKEIMYYVEKNKKGGTYG